MIGFEPRTSGVRSDRSNKFATTTGKRVIRKKDTENETDWEYSRHHESERERNQEIDSPV